MEEKLHELIPAVRQSLGNLPYEILSDSQIWAEIKRAWVFVDYINGSTNLKLVEQATIALAIYYTYINYTAIAEERMGNSPTASQPKYITYRDMALSYLRMITMFPLDDRLMLDLEMLRRDRGYGIGLTRCIT